MVIAGTLISFPLIWQLADMIMACMAITNLTAILLLSPVVYTLAGDYLRQRKLGVRPQFDPRRFRISNHNWRQIRDAASRD